MVVIDSMASLPEKLYSHGTHEVTILFMELNDVGVIKDVSISLNETCIAVEILAI
jgi:hypothetical protein